MRALAAAMLVVGAALLAAADDHPPSPRDEATVPVPPTEHQRVQYLRPAPLPPPPRHRDHQRHGVHLRPLRQALRRPRRLRGALRTAHHTAPARIPNLLLVRAGRVHFVAESVNSPISLRFLLLGQTGRCRPARASLTN